MSVENKTFMGKALKEIIVILPLADGSSLECGVFAYFPVNEKEYFALLPFKAPKELDLTQNVMLYEVQKDKDNNPLVMYIEDDGEFNAAVNYFSSHYSK